MNSERELYDRLKQTDWKDFKEVSAIIESIYELHDDYPTLVGFTSPPTPLVCPLPTSNIGPEQ